MAGREYLSSISVSLFEKVSVWGTYIMKKGSHGCLFPCTYDAEPAEDDSEADLAGAFSAPPESLLAGSEAVPGVEPEFFAP